MPPFALRLAPVPLEQDHAVRRAVHVQHRHGGRAGAARVVHVARARQAGHGPKARQPLARHVVRHEPAVRVAEDVDRPKVPHLPRRRHQLRQVRDVVLARLAALAALVRGVPEAAALAVGLPVRQQQREAVRGHALVEREVQRVVGGVPAEAVQRHDERRLAVDELPAAPAARPAPARGGRRSGPTRRPPPPP